MKSNSTPDGADDQPSPTWSDLREFSLRLEEERKHATAHSANDDDAWHWFLSLFSDRRNQNGESADQSPRRAA